MIHRAPKDSSLRIQYYMMLRQDQEEIDSLCCRSLSICFTYKSFEVLSVQFEIIMNRKLAYAYGESKIFSIFLMILIICIYFVLLSLETYVCNLLTPILLMLNVYVLISNIKLIIVILHHFMINLHLYLFSNAIQIFYLWKDSLFTFVNLYYSFLILITN